MSIDELWLIAGMVAATLSIRFPLLVLAGRLDLPAPLRRALRYVPVAVLSAIAVPMLLKPEGQWAINFSNTYLMAGVVAIATAALGRHLLMTITIGMAVFLLLRL